MKETNKTFKLAMSSIFLTLALVLPFLTGQIPEIGSKLCPMHIPIILCGFICGGGYGLLVGTIAPILRSLIFGMPSLYPNAICMSLELATYGYISGFIYQMLTNINLKKKQINVYITLLIAMLLGRIIHGLSMFMFLGFNINKYNLQIFLLTDFVNSIPGIIIQLILIPILIIIYEKYLNKKTKGEE